MMIVVVTGSRTWQDAVTIVDALLDIEEVKHDVPHTLIHGNARGADQLTASAARLMGWTVVSVDADWATEGRGAGLKRNLRMLDMHPDLVLAFWDGQSRGTKHCIDAAGRRGLNVRVVSPHQY